MELFVVKLICIVVAFGAIFLVAGQINRKKILALDGKITAAYSARMKWLTVFGYCVISTIPLLIADSLEEGSPILDGMAFIGIQGLFFAMILCTFNRRIVIGVNNVGVMNIFGGVRVIANSEMNRAIMSRNHVFHQSTNFTGINYTISVDDEMQNCLEVVAELRARAKQAA